MYTFDTNAIIYYLDEDPAVVAVLDPLLAQDIALFVSVVTELELLSYGSLTEEDMAEIAHLLTSLVVFPLESRLAHLAAALRRQYRLKTPDSVEVIILSNLRHLAIDTLIEPSEPENVDTGVRRSIVASDTLHRMASGW